MAKRVATWPAVPANNATIVLFATHDRLAGGSGALFPGMFGGGVRGIHWQKIDACEIVFALHNKASATSGIRVYQKDDQGTWRETDVKDDTNTATVPVQVPAVSAGAEARYLIDVARYARGWAVEYTAGADNPENWAGTITLHYGSETIIR